MTTLTPAYMARLAAKTRNLADDYAEAGYVELPDWLRALADIAEGKFPCGHEPQGPPVDGREVDRAPEREHDLGGTPHVPFTDRSCWCIGDDVETERYWARTPQTGGGAPSAAPAAVSPVAGESAPSPHRQGVRHLWLRVEDSRQWEDCWCLIGDDHVSEPRFEKEA